MTSLWRIFWLETVALWRGRTAWILLVGACGWLLALPRLVTGDGTVEGARDLCLRYGLGGVLALLVVSLLAAATGAVATEREAKRLQLTVVRPVSPFAIAWGKFFALAALGAFVLGVATLLVAATAPGSGGFCHHVSRPLMESPRAEAEKMYDIYMADPETPPEAKKAKKSVVLRLLEQRAKDNYQTVQTNETAQWSFPGLAERIDSARLPSVRLRFSNDFDMRDDVRGTLVANGLFGVVSNITQTAVVIPLHECPRGFDHDVLSFTNEGKSAVMLRPRQDVELLFPADAFAWNLLRAYIVMASVLASVIAFGVFLGAGLSRPVALFTAIVMLAVSEMSPSVVEQYPDQLETDLVDRVGLAMTRAVGRCAKPVSEVAPLGMLADGDCVERKDVLGTFALDFVLVPILLSALSAVFVRRKQEP